MLRSAFSTLDALVGGSRAAVASGRTPLAQTNMAVSAGTRRLLWTRRTPAIPWHQRARLSQLRASLPALRPAKTRTATRAVPFRKSALSSTAATTTRRLFHSSRARRSQQSSSSSNGSKSKTTPPEPEPTSFSARLRKLSREYGWAAVGVYLGLTVLDFPFCFLLVRTVGTERIAEVEHVVVSWLKRVIPDRVQVFWADYRKALREARGETVELVGHGVEEADERNKTEGASLATQLALAYAIHKSFIFVRVPLTAAVTPKVVKVLRSWGWQIGKKKVKSSTR